ncbi:glutamate--cysteine ligase [Streptomyces sp. NPDC047108]|uniref:glutamate--cysteine ligase 2 n=1 Tax=Streptomyces sp. NPDC047108 TaxID=3155025 RepID=UPI00340C22E7
MRSVGVEEELLLVDANSGEPRALSAAVLASATGTSGDTEEHGFEAELHREQLEFATRPQTGMTELWNELRRWRREAAHHAGRLGAAVAALATSPLEASPSISSEERYRWLQEQFGLTAQEQLTCGCHVHVSVASDEEGVAVLDRMRPWLPVLLALSANSPFWQGQDSRYGSYRSRVWGRWPSAGPAEMFGSAERYHAQVEAMLETGVLRDKGMIYFDARLSHKYDTVEVRVADVCLDPSTTLLLAALTRGLVERAAQQWRAGEPPVPHGVGVLRLAAWRAARSGLDGDLLHPLTMRPESSDSVVRALFEHVREVLDDGDRALVEEGLQELSRRGTGARFQRELFRRTGSLRDVVVECARRTAG